MVFKLDNSIKKTIRSRAFEDKKVKRDFRVLVERQFKTAHEKLMASFDRHRVTKELMGGPAGDNVTGTLRNGNLFGFIGFSATYNPISPLRNALAKANVLIHKSNKRNFTHTFRVHMPTKEDLYKITPLPWAAGASWLYALEEKGISNLGQYVFNESSNSRSGAGIQTNISRGGRLKISYLNPMLKEFERNLSKISGFRIK